MTFRNQCAVCKQPFDFQHTNHLMYFVIHGGDTYDKTKPGEYGDGMIDRWGKEFCSEKCFQEWHKEWELIEPKMESEKLRKAYVKDPEAFWKLYGRNPYTKDVKNDD